MSSSTMMCTSTSAVRRCGAAQQVQFAHAVHTEDGAPDVLHLLLAETGIHQFTDGRPAKLNADFGDEQRHAERGQCIQRVNASNRAAMPRNTMIEEIASER